MFPAILLVIAVVLFRLVPTPAGWENFSPMAAVVLCCAAYLPARWALAVPLSAFLVSDLALNAQNGVPLVNPNTIALLLAFSLVFLLGRALRGTGRPAAAPARPRLSLLFGASIAGSILFYLVTNSASWMMNPGYTRTLAGWVQCLTVGTPGFPPTWVFFRNSLFSDLFFTGLFVALCVRLPDARGAFAAPATTADSRHP